MKPFTQGLSLQGYQLVPTVIVVTTGVVIDVKNDYDELDCRQQDAYDRNEAPGFGIDTLRISQNQTAEVPESDCLSVRIRLLEC